MCGEKQIVFVDLETAGAQPWRPIIQIAAVAMSASHRELEAFEAKICFSQRRAVRRSLCKQTYNPARWRREAQPARVVAREFAAFLSRHASVEVLSVQGKPFRVAQLVAHNANFDGPFLLSWYSQLGLFLPGHFRVLCTLQRAQWLFQENPSVPPPKDYRLGTLCEYFGVRLRHDDAHDALADARATAQLYRAMIEGRHRLRSAA